jgi:predicted component of type VI protein secretion system
MKPIAELLPAVRSQPAPSFAARFGQQDLIVAEPYEKGRDYRSQPPLHPASVFDLMTRAPGAPIPVGRDARAVVQLDHAAVSRLHLVIAFAPQGWKVMDRSSNGTWLDEERMPQQQAVPLAYGTCIRLGRAMVVRVFTPEQFWELARRSAADQAPPTPVAAPPPPPPADPRASTWRFAPVPDSLLQPDPGDDSEVLPPLPRSAPTRTVPRPAAFAPPPPPPPPPVKSADAIDFEFDLDFTDGKGGFA